MLSEAYASLIASEICKALQFAHQLRSDAFPGGRNNFV